MSIKSKIGGYIKIKGINITDYATRKGTSRSNMHQKILKDKIYLKDLIELCNEYDCHVAIVDNKTDKALITFNDSDLE